MDFSPADGFLPPSSCREEVGLCLSSVTMHLQGLNSIDWVTSCYTLDAAVFRPLLQQRFVVEGQRFIKIPACCKSNTPGHWVWLAACFSWALFARWCYLLWNRVWWKRSKDFYFCCWELFFPHKEYICGNICQKLFSLTTNCTACPLCFMR